MVRTERESDRKRSTEKWQTFWCFRDQQRACRMALALQKNLSILGLLKRKEWPQCHRESSWQVRQSRLCQKKKEQSHLSRVPNCKEGMESRWARAASWRERGIRVGAWREKSELHSEGKQVSRRRRRVSKKSLHSGSISKHERVS